MTGPKRRTESERRAFMDGYADAIRTVERSGIDVARSCLATGRRGEVHATLARVRERDSRLAAAGQMLVRGLRRASTARARKGGSA
jgi:hypothetical protein